ncbi:MAG: amino acid ABC transporter permease [Frankiaceae bacterium]
MDAIFGNLDLYLRGFLETLRLSVLAAAGSLLLGTLLAAFRVSPIPPLRALGATYVEIVRNTPLTVVFFLLAFGLPQVGLTLGFYAAAVAALTLYTAAFVCEVVRSGINSVSTGQAEAARAIGFTFPQTLRHVVLPQAFRTVVPPLGNIYIAMVKNSAIAGAFGVSELLGVGKRLTVTNPDAVIEVLLGVGVAYLVLTLSLGLFFGVLERRVAIAH